MGGHGPPVATALTGMCFWISNTLRKSLQILPEVAGSKIKDLEPFPIQQED